MLQRRATSGSGSRNVNRRPWSADDEMMNLRLKSFWTSCFVSLCRCYQQHSVSTCRSAESVSGLIQERVDGLVSAAWSQIHSSSLLWVHQLSKTPHYDLLKTRDHPILDQTQNCYRLSFVSVTFSIYYHKSIHRIWIGPDPGCYDELCWVVCLFCFLQITNLF